MPWRPSPQHTRKVVALAPTKFRASVFSPGAVAQQTFV